MAKNSTKKEIKEFEKGIVKKTEDEFVRDMTAIVPRPKSEVRRRLNDIIAKTLQQERKSFDKMLRKEAEEFKLTRDVFYNKLNQFEVVNKFVDRISKAISTAQKRIK